MSHRYKEYWQRKREIDKQQEKLEWLHRQDSVFVDATIDRQFKTLDKLRRSINYYIRKNANNSMELITIEDTLLFLIAYSKLISTYSIAHLYNNDVSAKKFIDAINRLKKKGYIQKSEKRDEHGKVFYLLTEEGKALFESNVNTNNLIPYSEWNFNKDGIAYHDAAVGSVYTRLLLLDMPFRYSTYQYIKRSNYKDEIIPDARAEILYYSSNMRVLYIEGNTGSEDVEKIIAKIGKYYRKQFSTLNNHKFVFYAHEEKNGRVL